MQDDELRSLLARMHLAMARKMLEIVQSKDPDADSLREARIFLKENGVTARATGKPDPLEALGLRGAPTTSAPFPTDEDVADPYEDMN